MFDLQWPLLYNRITAFVTSTVELLYCCCNRSRWLAILGSGHPLPENHALRPYSSASARPAALPPYWGEYSSSSSITPCDGIGRRVLNTNVCQPRSPAS